MEETNMEKMEGLKSKLKKLLKAKQEREELDKNIGKVKTEITAEERQKEEKRLRNTTRGTET